MPAPLFFENYFGKAGFNKHSKIPTDIRRGFPAFYDSIITTVSAADLYLGLSTIQFELISYSTERQTRVINNIFRKESRLNLTRNNFLTDFHMCPECIKEDMEMFGEPYIHRSHQLSGVTACHKHHVPLCVQKTNKQCIYDYEIMKEMTSAESFKEECDYADYAHALLVGNIQSNSADIMKLICEGLHVESFNKKELVMRINDILDNGKTNQEYSVWNRKDIIFPTKELVKVLKHIYPDPNDVLAKIDKYELIIKRYCNECNQDYYTTAKAIEDGWGCTFCDEKIDEEELIKRIIKISGNGEYELKSLDGGQRGMLLRHHSCGKDISIRLSDFVFQHTRCNCGQKLQRKEADKLMRQHKDFRIVEFEAATKPAKIHHKICGQDFVVGSFRDFIELPKCRCCETQQNITQEMYEQRVRSLVGNEYTVLGEVRALTDKIKIRHNTCGHIQTFKASDFLKGSRCEKCYHKTSQKKLMIMLQEYSGDRYQIIGHDNYKYVLYDNDTNKEIHMLSKHIVQEILRPTPSLLLPVEKCTTVEKSLSTWDVWYQLCIDYKNEFGHLCPGHCEKYKGQALGYWCSEQRIKYNKKELSEKEIKLLQDINFVFNAVFFAWNKRFEEYKQYVTATGDMNPMEKVIYNGNKVGRWVRGQRHEEAKGKLNPLYKQLIMEFNPTFFDRRK